MVGSDGINSRVPSRPIVVKKIKVTRKRGAAKARKNLAKKQKPFKPLPVESSKIDPGPTGSAKISPTASFGLPTFRFEARRTKSQFANGPDRTNEAVSSIQQSTANSSSPFDLDTDEPEEDLPSDTLMTMHSLVQSDQGLHIPLTNNDSVQVFLECQVYSVFDDNHASTVNAELFELICTNKIRRMYCHDMSTMAFILTEDYVKAVWDYHNSRDEKQRSSVATSKRGSSTDDEIVAWFIAQLHRRTEMAISESSLVEQWETSRSDYTGCNTTSSRDVLRYLVDAQFLIRNPKQIGEESYFLWHPNWGIVLKTWNEARRKLLNLLAQRKEMSKANVLQKNRHSQVSTGFLLEELLSKEKIRLVERPFGVFVQLVKDA